MHVIMVYVCIFTLDIICRSLLMYEFFWKIVINLNGLLTKPPCIVHFHSLWHDSIHWIVMSTSSIAICDNAFYKMNFDSNPNTNADKELEDVVNEMKNWKASLKMSVKIHINKGEFLTSTHDDVNILQYIVLIYGRDSKCILIFQTFLPMKVWSNPLGGKSCIVFKEVHWDGYKANCLKLLHFKSTPNQCRICCQQSIMYYNKKCKHADSYQGTSLKNDKK